MNGSYQSILVAGNIEHSYDVVARDLYQIGMRKFDLNVRYTCPTRSTSNSIPPVKRFNCIGVMLADSINIARLMIRIYHTICMVSGQLSSGSQSNRQILSIVRLAMANDAVGSTTPTRYRPKNR